MSIIVLSSDSFCRGEEIARRVARDLDYEFLGSECVDQAASAFGASPEKLRKTLCPPPAPLFLSRRTREKHLAYFQATLLASLVRGDLVYAGQAGHMLVGDVSHIVKVKLTAGLDDRAARRAERDKIPSSRARRLLLRSDAARKAWLQKLYGADSSDPSRFDLVVDLSSAGTDGACSQIGQTAREIRFQPVTYSVNSLRDHELACRVRARLVDRFGAIDVTARYGEVKIRSKALRNGKTRKATLIRSMLSSIEDVAYVVFE